jgi:hypothetical protein
MAGNATQLFKSASQKELQEAMRQLGKYYGLKDNNTFMQILLMGAYGGGTDVNNPSTDKLSEDAEKINTGLDTISDALISLRGNGKYVEELIKVFEDFIAGSDQDDFADYLEATPSESGKAPIISFTAPNVHDKEYGFLRARSVSEVLGDGDFNAASDDNHSTISIIEIHHPNLNFSNRDTMAASIFLQALPSIEISKAVPYFDVKTIVKGAPFGDSGDTDGSEAFTNGMSIYKFLHGDRIEASDGTLKNLVSSKPLEFSSESPTLSGGVGQEEPPSSPARSIAGMELFTAPQTLVDGTLQYIDLDATSANYGPGAEPKRIPQQNKILDKFRPLMTFQSMSVQVTPATGMLATKSAEVKLILHDKTRMNQVMPFIIPGQLGDVEFQIEWGWSHPQSDPKINPYGALINSMRVKEKYGIMNSSYSFSATGEVEISLKLYTKGAVNATFELISNNSKLGKHPIDALRELVSSIREAIKGLKQQGYTLNAEMGAPDVLGKASSTKGLFTLDKKQKEEITKFIKNMKSKSSSRASSNWEQFSTAWDTAQDDIKSIQDEILEHFTKTIDKCTGKGNDSTDPYLLPIEVKLGKNKPIVNITNEEHVSFAKILLHFVAKPILDTDRFNEIEMIFYPMNEFAMWARDLNVGQYPINKKDLKELLTEELKKTPSITIQKFLNLMKKLFINFIGDDIYGLSKFYAKNKETGKRELQQAYKDDENKKQEYASEKVKVLEACYGIDGEKRFKKPNVQMWVECVSHESDPKQTILRLHFFDKATTSFSSYSQLWQAASSSDLGTVGKYNSAQKKFNKAVNSPPPKNSKNKDKEKWEELCISRYKRVSDHKTMADEQQKNFEGRGLLEPFEITKHGKDADGAPTVDKITKFKIRGGPDQLRGILAANMPTLKYGTEYSGILNASLSTNSNPQMETIHMQRQGKSSGPSGAIDNGLPMTVKPVELSIDTFGCPFINFGQQFFVDFQTNTTIDDIYAVSGVSHSISPTEFNTSIQLTPLNKLGQFRSMVDQFDDAAAIAKETSENTDDEDEQWVKG